MKKEPGVIVSLTSFPAALTYAAQAVKSVLDGSVRPDRVVLYLDTPLFPGGTLPPEIEALRAEYPIFEVRFEPDNFRSYKKLVHALRDFPDDVIVTVDDDIRYHPHLLRDMLSVHRKFPDAVVAHRVRKIRRGVPYKKWGKYKWWDFLLWRWHRDHHAMQTGVGGVLYPPRSLDEAMLDPQLFMSMAPTVDDVWFWAAAAAKGTYVMPVPFGRNHPRELGKQNEIALQNINVKSKTDVNRAALEQILARYDGLNKLIK